MAEILIIDDQDRYADLCRAALPQHHYHGPARNWSEARELLRRRSRVALVLLDVHFDIAPEALIGLPADATAGDVERVKRRQGLEILARLRSEFPDIPVILMTSRDEVQVESAADAGEVEEYTYFLDDDYVDARSLSAQIDSILKARHVRLAEGPIYWGRGLAMRRVRQRLEVLARGRLPVVLLGPTGTGKSLLARHFVHQRSRRSGRFVSVDLATLPKDLMAAHLFGSVKGAYTGSIGDRPGAFETAHKGTLFLDEIGNLSMDGQKMLLSVLQEGVVTRIGDLVERTVDVKLVVATNEDLATRVQQGTFRSDLYMRLNPATAVQLPGLTERKHDHVPLLRFAMLQALERPYLADLMRQYRDVNGWDGDQTEVVCGGPVPEPVDGRIVFLFPERAMRHLRGHDWPGNLREFAMVAENAALFALAELMDVPGNRRADVIQIRPKLVRDLLGTRAESQGEAGLEIRVRLEVHDTLNKVSQSCERQYFTELYLREKGDFAAMATVLLGSADDARKVQLRFNQLGLKVRELKARLD